MLLSPSPALQLHAQNALASIHPPSPELPAHAQLLALIYAVRWEVGITSSEFLSSLLEGERWLVWAAGNVRRVLRLHRWTRADLVRTYQGGRTSICTSACPCCLSECSKACTAEGGSMVPIRS